MFVKNKHKKLQIEQTVGPIYYNVNFSFCHALKLIK